MNPKFDLSDSVYYKNERNLVTRCLWAPYGAWIYEIISQISGHYSRVDEADLLSVDEWNTNHKHNQNNIGWAAMRSVMSDNMKTFNKTVKDNTCVCGAHKVKDARHSSWCEIKN